MTPEEIAAAVALALKAELPGAIAEAVRDAITTAEPLPPKVLFTAREASEITGLPASFFEDESAAGHIDSRKIGLKYRRYSLADIEFLVDAGYAPATSGPLLEAKRNRERTQARRALRAV